MAANLALKSAIGKEGEPVYERQTTLAKQIADSSSRATKIVNDLLDVTRGRFSSGLPVIKASMDMAFVV